jgi:hypothetical protein
VIPGREFAAWLDRVSNEAEVDVAIALVRDELCECRLDEGAA